MSDFIVLGDICRDNNYYGEVKRISPEAPIPIFDIKTKSETMGMSENVINNLKATKESVFSLTKADPISIKNRYFVNNQMVYRIDENYKDNLSLKDEETILEILKEKVKDAKVLILQDYAHGFFNDQFIQKIITIAKDLIIIADGHKSRTYDFYYRVDYLKLNEEEYQSLNSKDSFYEGLNWLRKGLIITKGEKGAVLKRHLKEDIIETIYNKQLIDVTGAGDTFTAHFARGLNCFQDEEKAMKIASVAAGISVENLGCYAPTLNEIENRL